MNKGWPNEPLRHKMSALGIKTTSQGKEYNPHNYNVYYICTDRNNHKNYGIDKNGVEAKMEIREEENCAVIYHLFVPKDKRGKGIGSFLIEQMEEIAKDYDLDDLFISIGHETGNLDSFMKNLGFKQCDVEIPRSNYGSQKYRKNIGDNNDVEE